MTLDETTRFRITNKFVGILGDEDAAKLMDAIPPLDWDRFATKDDITAATILTKAEMELQFANFRTDVALQFANFRTETALQFADVRTEFADVRTEFADVRTEFADVRTEMRTGFANLRAETALQFAEVRIEFADVRTEMRTGFANLRAEFAHSMKVNTFTIIGSLAALMTVFSVLTPLLN
jgi:hypothetical protein